MSEEDRFMSLLAAGIPVTLLLDICAPPDADEIYVTEGGDAGWLPTLHVGVA